MLTFFHPLPRKISSFLEHKDVHDTIRFFYQNKIRLNLKVLLKESSLKKRRCGRKSTILALSGFPTNSFSRQTVMRNFLESLPRKEDRRKSRFSALPELSCAWTDHERRLMVQAVCRYGPDFEAIATLVGTKKGEQCREYYRKYRVRLGLDAFYSKPST